MQKHSQCFMYKHMSLFTKDNWLTEMCFISCLFKWLLVSVVRNGTKWDEKCYETLKGINWITTFFYQYNNGEEVELENRISVYSKSATEQPHMLGGGGSERRSYFTWGKSAPCWTANIQPPEGHWQKSVNIIEPNRDEDHMSAAARWRLLADTDKRCLSSDFGFISIQRKAALFEMLNKDRTSLTTWAENVNTSFA